MDPDQVGSACLPDRITFQDLPIWVQQIWLFKRKLRTQTLLWAQNLNLRHIYLISFLIFGAVFCAFGFKVWKSTNTTFKKFILKNIRISCCFQIRWKSFNKMHQNKLWPKQVWQTWLKVEKVHISVTLLLITFFGTFFKTFWNRHEILRFWYPFWIFEEILVFGSY